ncbi:MAG: hypothetical protein HYZ15_10875 [Sphingobacteriales bacterium]|nr:hypothetical protein [Sphingobacteriales bacterium]
MKTGFVFAGFFTGLISFSCNHQQSPQQTDPAVKPPVTADTSLRSAWQVKGCAEKAVRAAGKFPESGADTDYPDLPSPGIDGIKAAGDSMVYTRYVTHLCCREVKVSVQRIKNIITVTEYWHRPGCKCHCSSTVRAVVRQLAPGTYQVYGIETGTDPVDDRPYAGKDTVMQQVFTVH